MGCTRAGALFAATRTTVRETVDARKQRFEAKDLGALFAGAKLIRFCKGTKVTDLDPADTKGLVLALGNSGSLRAPTARVGKRWLVGFGEAAWKEFLGGR